MALATCGSRRIDVIFQKTLIKGSKSIGILTSYTQNTYLGVNISHWAPFYMAYNGGFDNPLPLYRVIEYSKVQGIMVVCEIHVT